MVTYVYLNSFASQWISEFCLSQVLVNEIQGREEVVRKLIVNKKHLED